LTRSRTLLAICALVLPIPLVVAGCGGDDAADEDPRAVLERTFDNDTEVTSGVFALNLDLAATGEEEGSFSAEVGGPFQSDSDDPSALPQLDLRGTATGEGGGESIDFAGDVAITEDNAYVRYENQTYEVGEANFAELSEQFESQVSGAGEDEDTPSFREACEQAIEQAGGDPGTCDIDFVGDWLTNLENEGTEDVDGVETIHISGDLNVERVLDDLGEIAASTPGVNLQGFQPSQLATAVPESHFDLYTGSDDYLLRQLDIALAIDPSAATGGMAVVPVDRIDFGFSITLSGLNEPQTIAPPTGGTRPIEELLGEDAFDLRGFGDPGGDGVGGGRQQPGAEGPDADQAQDYLECIAEAEGDPEAIEACAAEL
jgi:hypothetical protein